MNNPGLSKRLPGKAKAPLECGEGRVQTSSCLTHGFDSVL
jgi:hypothetical protein